MRKFAGLCVIAVAIAGTGAAQTAAAGSEKTYWIGEGDARKTEISFVVDGNRVEEIFYGAGRAPCTDGKSTHVYKSMTRAKLREERFQRNVANNGDRFHVAGEFRQGGASGDMSARFTNRGITCESKLVEWEAEEVSRKEWKDFSPIGG